MAIKKQFLDGADQEMCEWAYKYLRGRDYRLHLGARSHYEACMALLNPLFEDTRKLLEKEMHAAWRQKKYIDRQKSKGKKPGNFVLSEACLDKLGDLAKELGMPINETLEKIIQQAHNKYQKKLMPKKAAAKDQLGTSSSLFKTSFTATDIINHKVGIPKRIPKE